MMFQDHKAPQVDECRIHECDAAAVASIVSGARLVHTDPPWVYGGGNTGLAGSACDHYAVVTMEKIAEHLTAAYDAAAPDAYLFLWSTWPKIVEWIGASTAMPWRHVTGGSWHKAGRMGIGFHVRGDSEPWLLYVKGRPRPFAALSNAYGSARTKHSEKPIPFLRQMIAALTEPGDLVLDVYAGRASCGVAARLEGRRYAGIEIDPERAEIARANIAQVRT